MNKNLIDPYNEEQERIKNALWAYMKKKGYSCSYFSRVVNVTPQNLLTVFRGGRMTYKIEARLRSWLDSAESCADNR